MRKVKLNCWGEEEQRRRKGRKLFGDGKYLLTVLGKLRKSNHDMGESVEQSEWHITACKNLAMFPNWVRVIFHDIHGAVVYIEEKHWTMFKIHTLPWKNANVLKSLFCPKWQTSAGEFVKWNLICRQIREGKTFNQMRKVQFQTSFNACYNSSL